MKIFNEIKKYYEDHFGEKTLVVATEAESRQIKEVFFGLGAEVVSDRDIVTLDYLLTQQLIQKSRTRLIDDFLFPYVNQLEEKALVLDYIGWVKNFPDPFIETEIFEVLKEYFFEDESITRHFERLEKARLLSNRAMEERVIPRSFAKLGLHDLVAFSNQYVFLESLLKSLPFGFQEAFCGGTLGSSSNTPEWNQQIDLYKASKNRNIQLEFSNFRSQIEEVRFILKKLSENESRSQNIVLYPKNKGYETLFFIYQREFFKEQRFFYQKREKTFLADCLKSLQSKVTSIETNYSHSLENKNQIISSKKSNEKISLKDVMAEFAGKFTEYDLNLIAPIAHQIDQNVKMPISDWVEILSEIENKEKSRLKKLITTLPIEDYTYFPTMETENLYIMGWGDYLFNKSGERLFSNSILHGIERDLGLSLTSLNRSMAGDLMKNPLIWNEGVKKTFLYSEKTAVGRAVKPGVFKILWDEENLEVETERFTQGRELSLKRELEMYKENKVSASSLQRYDECPYKFYLEKVLKFNFEEEEDYFLSAKEEGLLIHKALEEVKNQKLTKKQFKVILEELIFTEIEEFNHFRKAPLSAFVDHLWMIIESERRYLKEKSVVKVESEKFFSFNADLKTKSFSKEGSDFKVVGVIDRIDLSTKGGAFLYDYKRADTGTISLARYTGSKLSPQLFLYCIAADKGFLGAFKDFLGFQYINVKTYKRLKGFVDKETGVEMAKEVPMGSAILTDKYQEKVNLFLENFWEVLEKIGSNSFEAKPNPAHSGTCASCNWVGVCKKSDTFQ